ncbi:MAG: glutamate racemase [Acidobacteriota bacterium]
MMRGAIGIFDSGVGGLTVLTALRKRLPDQDYLYLGDTARLPYGSKSETTIRRYALNAASHLFRHDVRLLVVACNTASAHALPALAEISPVPVLGVVEPGVRAAVAGGARRIAVIGTEGTIRSGAYQDSLHRLAPEVSVTAAPCPLFVPLAEEGWGDHPITDQVAELYLRPLLDAGLEAIILGCTHYPLLKPSLARVAGPGVSLIDSASAVTDAVVQRYRGAATGRAGAGRVVLHLTDASDRFRRITRTILGGDPEHLEVVDL